MQKLLALLLAAGLAFAQPSLTLEESQNAMRFCYGAGVGLSQRMVSALLAGGLFDGMNLFRFDCKIEEYQGGIRVLLYLDDQPLEETATWLREPEPKKPPAIRPFKESAQGEYENYADID